MHRGAASPIERTTTWSSFVFADWPAGCSPWASAPSGWYMNTGEGRAVAAGTEDLEGVDLGDVLDHRFRLAVQAVAEVNASGAVAAPDRFDRVQRAYQEKLGQVGHDA